MVGKQGVAAPVISSRFWDSSALYVSYCITVYTPASYYTCCMYLIKKAQSAFRSTNKQTAQFQHAQIDTSHHQYVHVMHLTIPVIPFICMLNPKPLSQQWKSKPV